MMEKPADRRSPRSGGVARRALAGLGPTLLLGLVGGLCAGGLLLQKEHYWALGLDHLARAHFVDELNRVVLLAALAELAARAATLVVRWLVADPLRIAAVRAGLRLWFFGSAALLLWINHAPWFPASRSGPGLKWNGIILLVLGLGALACALLSSRPLWTRVCGAVRDTVRMSRVAAASAISIGALNLAALGAPAAQGPPVILVSMDTLRWDYVSALGGPEGTTPNIDALARDGVAFQNAISQAAWTLPSHMSLFTGQHPSRHAVVHKFARLDRTRSVMLAELLANAGYRSAAFTSGGYVGDEFGFARGFDSYRLIPIGWFPVTIRDWLSKRSRDPFLLFLHNYSIHNYWAPDELFASEGVEQRPGLSDFDTEIRELVIRYQQEPVTGDVLGDEIAHLKERYRLATRHLDAQLGQVLGWLRELDLYDQSLIVVFSDHGEEFGEHGHTFHRQSLYEEMVHVPLVVKFPAGHHAGRRVERAVQLVDLFPTVLAEAGVEAPDGVQIDGAGLQQLLDQPGDWDPDRGAFSELYYQGSAVALRNGSSKLLYKSPADGGAAQLELFDLGNDPGEQQNLAADDPALESRLVEELLRRFHGARAARLTRSTGRSPAIDPATQRRLEALGYMD